MDAAERIELIEDLCAIEGRGPGTDAERRAAKLLAGRLKRMGRKVETEPTYVHPNYALVHAITLTLAIAGSLLAIDQPAIGFALVFLATTSFYLDHSTRAYLIRSLLFRRASQNVVSRGDRPLAPLRVILTAHYDAAPTGYVFGERGLRTARRLSERARVLLGPWRLIFWGCLAALLPILGLRMAGIDAGWVSALQVVPTILLILAVFLLIDIALSKTVPGAYDNASGVAAVLSIADDLRADPAENLDVWVVLPGSEESLDEGMRAFLRRHRKELDPENTVFLNVDSVSYGTPHYQVAQGPIITYPMDAELVEFCEALAAAEPRYGARPVRVSLSDDATPIRVRGWRVTSITGLKDGLPPPWYHTPEDTPDRIDADAMANATDFVTALVRLLDRDAGRRIGQDLLPEHASEPAA
jgi:hypothetical protein